MNRMIKIFIGILCFIAFFSYNNNDNISTAQINGATTTTIDDDLSSADADVQQAQERKACTDAQVADDHCDKYEPVKLRLPE